MRRLAGVGTVAIGFLFGAGCASGGSNFSESIWNPFGLKLPFAADEEPIRIGVVSSDRGMLDIRSWWNLDARTPWSGLQEELAKHTGRPVQVMQLQLFQISPHLESGWLNFALLTDEQCAQVTKENGQCHAIARASALKRTGLIVVKAESDIQAIGDLVDKRFAFGPKGDPVLHYGAAAALNKGGVSIDKIKREVLPVINTLQYHINSDEAAKEVAFGTTPAGVIDKADYDGFAETGGRLFPLKFSKDQFRVLGATTPVKVGPFVASVKADEALVKSVREFLLSAGTKRPNVTTSLGIAGFTGVTSTPANACGRGSTS